MSILIDLIIVAIFVLMIIISARQGFVKALTRLIGFAVVIAVVAVAVNPLADLTYQKAIEPSVVNAAGDLVIEGGDRAADSIWESLPTFITDNADDFGISKDKISNTVDNKISFHWKRKANHTLILFEDLGVTINFAFLPNSPIVALISEVVNIDPYNITTPTV